MSLHFHLVFNFQSFIDLLLLAVTPGYVTATGALVLCLAAVYLDTQFTTIPCVCRV